jgi:hypothetical protein
MVLPHKDETHEPLVPVHADRLQVYTIPLGKENLSDKNPPIASNSFKIYTKG